MGDIPLMRAGFALMAVIAAVGGLSMVVLPDEHRGGKDHDKDKDRDRAEAPAPAVQPGTPLAAAQPAMGDSARAFGCAPDGASVSLPETVHESSGLALAAGGDAIWTHNDSGRPLLHLVGMDGRDRGQVTVTGVDPRSRLDWEDVAAAPCPGGGRCLYVGDIGDNAAARPNVTIYRVPEPAPGDAQTRPAEALTAVYPDGPQDAEALFVLPDGGIFIVSKGETGGIAVYRMPRTARPGTPARLERMAVLAPGKVERPQRITGAAASPDGQWLALRTLRQVSFYRTGGLASGQLGQPLTYDLTGLNEPQGEAVEFGPDGTVFLSSEGGSKKNPATLSRLACVLPSS
ncbi:hypothetical protein [Longimicrobium sp.]|uniref:hypothetical protein n=1 Tax=Longimicrobium sp. TaxID=2029185 RepID=UPI002E32DAE7|nr:hypothetical protein [Longimicrobium sp.]HEX6042188.1 hypothetical protein [Longimicrobium sp.]